MPPLKHPATLLIITLCTLTYLATAHLHQTRLIPHLLISEYTAPVLPEIRHGHLWRLITPLLLHLDIFHLVFNMLWTWELARPIETRHNTLTLILFTVLIGTTSNLAQYWVAGPWFGGMSGVIYGYLGYLWLRGNLDPAFNLRLPPPILYLLIGWFALGWTGILDLLFNIKIANTAHTAGLLTGLLIALITLIPHRLRGSP